MNTTIYQTVTDRILKQLEAGQIPWRKTWTTGLPKSLTTGKEYRGVNILVLGSAEYSSRYWLTYRQTQNLGGHVRKGERATPVIYWKWRTVAELRDLSNKTGRESLSPCVPFASAVFNLDQVEGIEGPQDDVPRHAHQRFEIAERMLEVIPDKPEIVHSVTTDPVYNRSLDRVALPHLSQFESASEYYSTLFHELVHATGHEKRLNRFSKSDGNGLERYSFEELVAEFGTAFLCAFTGVENLLTQENSTGYIESWAAVFRRDSRILLRAAGAAQRAADYLRGKISAPVSEVDPNSSQADSQPEILL